MRSQEHARDHFDGGDGRCVDVVMTLAGLAAELDARSIRAIDRWLAAPEGKREIRELVRGVAGLEAETRSALVGRLRANHGLRLF